MSSLPIAVGLRTPLELTAHRVRESVIRFATGGGCFLGASLSCADLLVSLYSEILRITPETLSDPRRDYLLLSKGHDVPALYATLAELGFLDPARLANHLKAHDSLYWHPSRDIPGVEFHSGSLGHLLSVAIGIALDIKLSGGPGRVFVILGDGELNEGSCWEACLVAHALKLDNLVAVVDRNGFQANAATEELLPLEPLQAKFEAFGWAAAEIDGHSFSELGEAFRNVPFQATRPSVVIARTVRGKGVPSLEGRVDRWFCDFDADEIEDLLEELRGRGPARLVAEPQVVR